MDYSNPGVSEGQLPASAELVGLNADSEQY